MFKKDPAYSEVSFPITCELLLCSSVDQQCSVKHFGLTGHQTLMPHGWGPYTAATALAEGFGQPLLPQIQHAFSLPWWSTIPWSHQGISPLASVRAIWTTRVGKAALLTSIWQRPHQTAKKPNPGCWSNLQLHSNCSVLQKTTNNRSCIDDFCQVRPSELMNFSGTHA